MISSAVDTGLDNDGKGAEKYRFPEVLAVPNRPEERKLLFRVSHLFDELRLNDSDLLGRLWVVVSAAASGVVRSMDRASSESK